MEEAFEAAGVRGALHRPERPGGDGFLLTHGAGSNRDAPLLVHLAHALAAAGYTALRYDLPFRQLRPKGPPFPAHAARDREGIAQAAEAMRGMAPGRIFAAGHSYGGRQTAMLAAERPELFAGLLLLSYPLHPPGKPEAKRTKFFPQWRAPALFVHGTSDPFGSIEELQEATALIPARTEVMPVEGTGHDLKRAAGRVEEILARFRAIAG